ncbi:hypothetical protein OESDEN_10375 [Oesophagostomum dentatum]|uniref:Uncharacterized protein n=1 Tax=Oesophagostomum dentatum TaxID=61180 RepID=A0A0B1T315_OESDE|nr:hypothetical protein OESDEN_10375 [Oesophagostomum dentatum]
MSPLGERREEKNDDPILTWSDSYFARKWGSQWDEVWRQLSPSRSWRKLKHLFWTCKHPFTVDTDAERMLRSLFYPRGNGYMFPIAQQSTYIRFTQEEPKEGWLLFLNVRVHLAQGVHKTQCYRKPSHKSIMVQCSSAHPTQSKTAIVPNMSRTAANV